MPCGPLQWGHLTILTAQQLSSPRASDSQQSQAGDVFYNLILEVLFIISTMSYGLYTSAIFGVGGDYAKVLIWGGENHREKE